MHSKPDKRFRAALLTGILLCAVSAMAVSQDSQSDPTVGLRNTPDFLFAADSQENLIDVVSVHDHKVVHRFETDYHVDQILATPNAPMLIYSNIEHRRLVAYNLLNKTVYKDVELPISPRHMVLDTTGFKIGITDSVDGGFVLFNAYSMEPMLEVLDLVPTSDVLFDPNEVDIYYSNNNTGAVGLIDSNTGKTWEMSLYGRSTESQLSSPSRSLDARYIYVADQKTSKAFALSAFTQEILESYDIASPARPYSTPAGYFLYLLDKENGKFTAIEQNQFTPFAEIDLPTGIDTVVVSQFDRMNLLLSTQNKHYYLFDNTNKRVTSQGEFDHIPLTAQATVDGKKAFISFSDAPLIAALDF
ncbi:MAG: hypothetical protein HOM55_02785, partial [Proteobacteria bacterium]|nr:hypothetical protein [Pseudomonadota bacterium]